MGNRPYTRILSHMGLALRPAPVVAHMLGSTDDPPPTCIGAGIRGG
jgi:hypothetical protein